MDEGWRRFLLQWILPVGVFGLIVVIVLAAFNANIKNAAATDYEGNLLDATKHYATNVYSSVQKSEAVGSTVAASISDLGLNTGSIVASLNYIVEYSDAYAAVYCNSDGSAVSDTGDKIDIQNAEYYADLMQDSVYEYYFVQNDGIMGNPALIINIPVDDNGSRVLAFYPMGMSNIKRIVTVDKDYDSKAYCMILDSDGSVLASTFSDNRYILGSNIWEELLKTNAAATIRRVKTRVQSGNSGTFSALINDIQSFASFSPIPGTNKFLMLVIDQTAVNKAEDKLAAGSSKKLVLLVSVMAIFIVVITITNIVQIYVTTRNKEALEDKADTDLLTGLKNKIATEREIKEYMEANPDKLAMMFLVDLDNFKKINDTMGHAFGDEVLRELGRNIGVNFRVTDVIGRIGGDEFMIFLKNLKEDPNTIKEAQKLSYFFKHFQVGDYVKYSVTASIGAAVFPAHGTDFESLYKSADAAVYKSKKRGKNQLSFFDDRDRTPEEVAYADAHQISIERKEENTPIES